MQIQIQQKEKDMTHIRCCSTNPIYQPTFITLIFIINPRVGSKNKPQLNVFLPKKKQPIMIMNLNHTTWISHYQQCSTSHLFFLPWEQIYTYSFIKFTFQINIGSNTYLKLPKKFRFTLSKQFGLVHNLHFLSLLIFSSSTLKTLNIFNSWM